MSLFTIVINSLFKFTTSATTSTSYCLRTQKRVGEFFLSIFLSFKYSIFEYVGCE